MTTDLRGADPPLSWDFPAIEALGDAVVIVAVDGLGSSSPTLRLAHANRTAEKVFGITAGGEAVPWIGEVDRLLAVAGSGHADSWVSRHAGGWYELRATVLAAPPDPDGVFVLVVARDLGTVSTVPSEAAGVTRVALLLEISRQLGAAVREDQVAQVFFDLVCPALGAEPGRLAVVQPDGGTTVLRRTPSGDLVRTPAVPGSAADEDLLRAARNGVAPTPAEPTGPSRPDGPGPAGSPGDTRSTVLTVPLRAGASTVGAIALPVAGGLSSGRGRLEFVETVAALVAQAVQRARLFDAQLEASLALQHALLPPMLPEVEGLELAARYRAGSGHEVGGDWYDVVPLASGWVAFVIGDVQGHDLPAAALMGQIRSVVRAYLLDELPPSAALSSTNAFLLSLRQDRLVTVCIALVHPRSRLVTLATAGHACPLMITAGHRGELLTIPTGPPLGVLDNVIWRERTTPLPTDTTLLLYTDGLIERRARSYADGERALLDLAALLPDGPADLLADAVLTMAGVDLPGPATGPAAPGIEDDTALLLLRWHHPARGAAHAPDAAGGGHVRTLPVAPASAVIARWYVDDLLLSWGVAEPARETAVLLTDEIVANAVRHAHRTIRLDVTARTDDVLVEVFDDSHREPRLGGLELDATSGRGLQLVEALATAWGVRTSQGDLGKTVWFTLGRTA